ncbi:MAG: hypothetical protein ACE5GE_04340 [Phycisphaerae bacterium]
MACLAVACLLGPLAGCAQKRLDVSDPATQKMLSLLMPVKIIIDPITGLKSFDDDDQPDGIIVALRAVDAFGDRVKIAGSVLVELYEFRPASGEAKGRKIEQWEIQLASARDQRRYWNRFAEMYDLPLMLSPEALASASPGKYVVEVTHNNPLGEHMMAEHVFEPPVARQPGLAGR